MIGGVLLQFIVQEPSDGDRVGTPRCNGPLAGKVLHSAAVGQQSFEHTCIDDCLLLD
jgi:hypothetical protein